MRGYIILEDGDYSSVYRAKGISRELYQLGRPLSEKEDDDISRYIFDWIQHKDTLTRALMVDTQFDIIVHSLSDAEDLLKYYECTEQEKQRIRDIIKNNNKIKFQDLMTSDMSLESYEDLNEKGWFIYYPEITDPNLM